jgi:leader peptidase (prepilin peptidase)/N-methyltransferase
VGDVALAGALAWLTALTVYDIRQRRLPNLLTLPGAVLVLVGATLAGRGTAAVLGGLLLAAVYLLVHLISPAAMGAGDVKLAVGVGALTGAFGPDAWVVAAVGAPLLTAVWGLVALRRRGERVRVTVPHGPSMCMATAAAVAMVIT